MLDAVEAAVIFRRTIDEAVERQTFLPFWILGSCAIAVKPKTYIVVLPVVSQQPSRRHKDPRAVASTHCRMMTIRATTIVVRRITENN